MIFVPFETAAETDPEFKPQNIGEARKGVIADVFSASQAQERSENGLTDNPIQILNGLCAQFPSEIMAYKSEIYREAIQAIVSVLEMIAPALTEAALKGELIEMIDAHTDKSADIAPVIRIHPATFERISDFKVLQENGTACFELDESVAENGAEISFDNGGAIVAPAPLVEQIIARIRASLDSGEDQS